eukprot:10118557-Alexandrium_andersonii.AAC.1
MVQFGQTLKIVGRMLLTMLVFAVGAGDPWVCGGCLAWSSLVLWATPRRQRAKVWIGERGCSRPSEAW